MATVTRSAARRPRAYVRVQGPDAADLLQRLLSNDVLAAVYELRDAVAFRFDRVDARLDEHTRILNEHTGMFQYHENRLDSIDRRLLRIEERVVQLERP